MELAVDHPHERDDAAVLVVARVEDQRARRRVRIARRRGDPLDDRVEHVRDAFTRLGRDSQHALGRLADQLCDLVRRAVGIRLREVDLVHDRRDLEVVLDREVRIRERLRLDALRGVDDEQRSLARLERARDLVREVDVTGGVDQVQLVPLPGHAHGLRLDRDPALALEVHRVEHLLAHLALGDGVGQLEDAVGERRLAVVDVRDDREVADAAQVHGVTRVGSARRNESSVWISRTPSRRGRRRGTRPRRGRTRRRATTTWPPGSPGRGASSSTPPHAVRDRRQHDRGGDDPASEERQRSGASSRPADVDAGAGRQARPRRAMFAIEIASGTPQTPTR